MNWIGGQTEASVSFLKEELPRRIGGNEKYNLRPIAGTGEDLGMKLVIFIGHFKTGSSSLQSFLASNFLGLLRQGILYPSVETQGVARNLKSVLRGKELGAVGAGLNITEPHNALALKLKTEEDGHGVPPYYPHLPSGFQMLEMIENQINELSPNSVVLCSEVFALLGLTENRESIARLARRFSHHDVTIYCNLRRPDEYLSSWHRQRLKFGAALERLSDKGLDEYFGSAHFEQAKVISGWFQDYFPNANLIVRNFSDVKSSGGSVLDFVKNSGIKFPANLEPVKDQNPSVPSALAEIGRRANHELPRPSSSEVIHWLTTVQRRVDIPSDSLVETFGSHNRERLLRRFRPVSEELDLLTGASPFYPDLNDFGVTRPIDELEAAREALPLIVKDASGRLARQDTLDWLGSLAL